MTRRPILNHLLRFARRLRAHRIPETSIILPLVEHISDGATVVVVGNRLALIDSEGNVRPALRPVGTIYDRCALNAHRNRWHAVCLGIAADSRRRGWIKAGRINVETAAAERQERSMEKWL